MKAIDVKAEIIDKVISEMNPVVDRAIEYGAHDLQVMGAAMLALLPPEAYERFVKENPDMDSSTFGQCMAIAFYQLGKVARVFGSMMQGQWPRDDTEYDLRVYSFMFEHVKEHGEWKVEPDGILEGM